ncbi:hypothetical protein F5Y18DRAFT_421945 [Xylariaceae sp. FL1019]|nr:hypothetical protein F5Y18DRAFT_421945 [Xylariaceae sp. FL1019]
MLSTLPTELIEEILSHVGDVRSLLSATQTCRALQNAYFGGKDFILNNAVCYTIHPSVLPDAIASFESRPWKVHALWTRSGDEALEHRDTITAFAEGLILEHPTAPTFWDSKHAVALLRFHSIVEHFAAWIIKTCFSRVSSRLGDRPPTNSEIRRVQSALYRWETCRNLFGLKKLLQDDGPFELSGPSDLYFPYFAQHQIEQMLCVDELLTEVVAEPFNDMVDHDVQWGDIEVPYINDRMDYTATYLLARGLEFIFKLSTEKSYTQLRKMLSLDHEVETRCDDEPGSCRSYLGEIYDEREEELYHYGRYSGHSRLPVGDDMDPGPQAAWEWGYCFHYYENRSWGYVFWDMDRLERSGVLQTVQYISPLPKIARKSDVDAIGELDHRQRVIDLLRSRLERKKIKSMGGFGWWDFGDRSRIVWGHRYPRTTKSSDDETSDDEASGPVPIEREEIEIDMTGVLDTLHEYLRDQDYFRLGPITRISWEGFGEEDSAEDSEEDC